MRDEVFHVSKLVEPYRVAPSTNLEELNVVLSTSRQANVDPDDDDDIHIEDCDGAGDDSIDDKEEEHSD